MTMLSVYLVVTLSALLNLCNGEDVHLETRLGSMVGTRDDDTAVSVFYNIPFAKPPVGSLRFAKPVPYGSWSETLNATTPGNRCMQTAMFQSFAVSEDCLQLNVYVPASVNVSAVTKTPVMVFVHGGGFTSGGADTYDGTELARQGDVILVTIQYRLGIFGFFSLGTEDVAGNYGLWDQMLALQWVHQNIDSFGGDAGKVTVMGHSAGGISVSILSLIPANRNLFHRAIVQSGTLAVSNSRTPSYAVGELSGCSKSLQPTDFVNCLRNKDAGALLAIASTYMFTGAGLPFGPNVDGVLLKQTPEMLMNHENPSEEYNFFSSLDFMTGTMRADGNLYLLTLSGALQKAYGINLTAGVSSEDFCNYLVPFVVSGPFNNNTYVSKRLCEEYRVQNNVSEQSRQMIQFLTDFGFNSAAYKSLHSHSHHNLLSNTYQYVFEKAGGPSYLLQRPSAWYVGPGHGDELFYLFPNAPLTDIQKNVSDSMIRYWTNFAKTGNPNEQALPNWPSYNHADESYLLFGNEIKAGMEYKEKQIDLWDEEIPQILEQSNPIVNTSSGQVQGTRQDVADDTNPGSVSVFYNIPFAAPPVGQLRFSKPEPYGSWSGIRDATRPGPECMQSEMTYLPKSEDCLQLNVYVPNVPTPSAKKSVMVWVHGGGYLAGSGIHYDGSYLAHHGDVIVVTINYRLGIFGFLSLNDPAGKGNYGLWDQIFALKWVQQNIAAFGGDPSSVTIFGESAGGFSVSLLSLIPSNRGLFQRVISQSGVAASRWAFGDSEPATRSVGDMVGCSRQLSGQLYIECMRNVNASTLNDNMVAYLLRDPATIRQILEFTPGVDGELFSMGPERILSNSSSAEHEFFSSLDLISGTVRNEGSLLAGVVNQPAVQQKFNINATAGISTTFMCDNFTKALVADFFKGNDQIKKLICEKYTAQNNLYEQGQKMLDIFSDFLFVAPSFVQLQSHSLQNIRSKSFQYVLERQFVTPDPSLSYYPPWYSPPGHFDDVIYLFPNQMYIQLNAPADLQYSKVMTSYWTNFAKSGDPNGQSVPFWPAYDTSKQAYQLFGNTFAANTKYQEERISTWNRDIPRIMDNTMLPGVQVQTPLGIIRGLEKDVVLPTSSDNRKVFVFYGIPFAKPPVGELRFAKPQPYGKFNVTFNATSIGSVCLQPRNFTNLPHYSEDCLNLNIYVPNNLSTSNQKSVMVFIHGGSYALGAAILTDGSILATKGDVIVVTLNYRLGIFGFFSLNDADARGNYGIWDQILALQWVKDNIASFGGNPDSITIFGESAGAFSVSLLSLVPQNKGLFHRVIAQSGTAVGPLAFGDSRSATVEIGKLLQCEYTNSDAFVKCMRSKNAEDILRVFLEFLFRNPFEIVPIIDFLPGLDNELFLQTPTDTLRNKSSEGYKFFSSLDLMSGVMRQEGSVLFDMFHSYVQEMYNFDINVGIPTVFVCNYFIPAFIDVHYPVNQQLVKSAACDKYRDTSSEAKQGTKALDFAADLLFTIPMVNTLNAHSTNNVQTRTFQYLVTEKSPYQYYSAPPWYEGPGHADDLGLVFQFYTPPVDIIADYLAVSDKMIAYWSNFAKNGDPNDNTLDRWPVYNNVTRGYIILDRGTKADLKFADIRVKFWLEELPDRLAYKPPTTTAGPNVSDDAARIRSQYVALIFLLHCLIRWFSKYL